MQKTKLRLLAISVLLCSSIIFSSCSKSDSESTDVIGNWKRSSEFEGYARTEAVSFTIGDKVYVGGGYDGSNRLNDFWEFNQSNGTWLRKSPFPGAARTSAVAFTINGKGYVGTGYDGINKLADFWEYNPATDSWTRVADFGGTARYGATAFSIGDKGYVTTGFDGNYLKDLWEYNATTNTWTQKASITGSKRTDAISFVYDNKGYVVTGVANASYVNDFWVYDPSSDSWTEKRKITSVSDEEYDDDYGSNITRSNAVAFLMNGKVYLTSGYYSGVTNTTYEYNIATDTWTQKTSLEASAREGAIGFSISNRGYITTGNNSSQRFDDLWEFFPDAEADDTDN
jgi:N-acetylneuraminic acid mutarotase